MTTDYDDSLFFIIILILFLYFSSLNSYKAKRASEGVGITHFYDCLHMVTLQMVLG